MSSSPPPPSSSGSSGSLRSSGPLSSFAPLTVQPSTVAPRRPRSLVVEWALAGSATMCACLFTNPMEVVKSRMQLQNELASRGSAPVIYRNALQAFVDIGRREGVRGLQGGLGPSLLYQLTMNGTRLGLYEPFKRLIRSATGGGEETGLGSHRSAHRPPVFWHNVLASGASGAIAAFMASPAFLVKVRLQVQAKNRVPIAAATGAGSAAATVVPVAGPAVVGAQHQYTSALGGLRAIYAADGIAGLYRGASASVVRVTTGSVVQLSTYDFAKHEVMRRTGWNEGVQVQSDDSTRHASPAVSRRRPVIRLRTLINLRPHVLCISSSFASSLLTGFFATVAMNPPDVISTRLYNQPVVGGRGTLYTGWLDCARKTVRAEGVRGLYKGFLAHYLRLGPHTIVRTTTKRYTHAQ
jgi:solute carrier family 25 protein 34/35